MSEEQSNSDTRGKQPADAAAFDTYLANESAAQQPDVEAQLEEQRDRALRLQADMQNLRQRMAREISDERRYGPLSLMRDVLPVVDNVDRAIEAAEKNADAGNLLEGFRMVRQQLLTVLQQHHCEPICAEGAEFDPDFHEAILQQPSADHPPGTVIQVTQPGYRLHDRVVRPSQVIVSSAPPEVKPPEEMTKDQ